MKLKVRKIQKSKRAISIRVPRLDNFWMPVAFDIYNAFRKFQ